MKYALLIWPLTGECHKEFCLFKDIIIPIGDGNWKINPIYYKYIIFILVAKIIYAVSHYLVFILPN